MSELSLLPAATVVARLSIEAQAARRLADVLGETFDPETVAVAAFETPDGRWSLALHFRDQPDEAAVRALVASAAGAAAADALEFATLAPTDWVRRSLEGLKPVEAGRFVVHGAHDRARIRKNRIAVEIEAGLAFGTGHHGTTRGCLIALDWIAKRQRSPLPLRGGRRAGRGGWGSSGTGNHPDPLPFRRREQTVLDVGTGTGVLAIAAAKALRLRVLASDVDRRAVKTARDNARINGVGPFVEVVHAAGLNAQRLRARAPAAIVLANILLEPLRQLATPFARVVAPGGYIVLSGLLAGQTIATLAAYRARGLVLARRIPLEGWMTVVVRDPRTSRPRA